MSLFGNPSYQYRETYFVLFPIDNRPTAEQLSQSVESLGDRYEIKEVHRDPEGRLESMTIIASSDFAGMTVTYVAGEEVSEQIAELNEMFKKTTLTRDEISKIGKISGCNARFDVMHFEEVTSNEDDFLDPGSMLTIVETVAKLVQGVGFEQESLTIV